MALINTPAPKGLPVFLLVVNVRDSEEDGQVGTV